MDPLHQALLLQIGQISANCFRGHLQRVGQFGDGDPAVLPGQGEDLLTALDGLADSVGLAHPHAPVFVDTHWNLMPESVGFRPFRSV